MARPRLRTPLCDMLGIEYPILLAGMGTIGFGLATPPALVAAVSEAGGMGVMGTSGMGPDQLRDSIREIRRLTSRPFGIDVLLPEKIAAAAAARRSLVREQVRALYPAHWEFVQQLKRDIGHEDAQVGDQLAVTVSENQQRLVDIILEERVALFAAALGLPQELAPHARAQGMKVLALAGNVAHARRHRDAGVDFVVAVGTEAGGHTGRIATMPLVPQVVDAVSPVPVIAGGGIGSGRQVAAALALGAIGVWVGSAFLVSDECEIGDVAKDLLIKADSGQVDIHRVYTGKPMRGLKNAATEAWARAGLDILPLPYQKVLMDDFQLAAELSGKIELEANPGGQIVGMLKERRPAAVIFREMVEEAVDTIARLQRVTG